VRSWFGQRRSTSSVKVVLGLGNPGAEYEETRHNVGWWLVDHLAGAWGFEKEERGSGYVQLSGRRGDHEVVLVKPLTFMNRSGASIASLRRIFTFDATSDLLVVVDDVSLPPGRARFRPGGSAGGHNGLKSVEAAVRTRDYARLRIGVGGAPAGWDLAEWVLSRPEPEEEEEILGIFPRLSEGVEAWLDAPMTEVMSRYNG